MGQTIDVLVRILGNANGLVTTLRQAQAALRQYGSAITGLSGATNTGTRALGQLATSARSTQSIMLQVFLRIQQASGGLGRSLVELGRSAFYLTALVNVFRTLAQGATQLGQALLMPTARAEQADIAFRGLLGSAEAATAVLARLRDFAARTPFEFAQLRTLTQQLLAAQVPASQLIPVLTAVGDAVAGIGGGNEEMASVIRALTQIQSRGRLAAEEMLQLTEARIPAWQILAREMGVSVGKLQDMVTDGLVPASVAIPALVRGMEAAFGGQMAAQSTTLLGIISNIRDVFDTLREVFGTPIRLVLVEQLQRFLALISGDDAIRRAAFLGNAVAQGLAVAIRALQSLYGVAQRVLSALSSQINRVGGSFAGFAGMVVAALQPLGRVITTLLQGDIEGAGRLLRTGIQNIGAIIFGLLRGLSPELFSGGVNTIAAFASGMIAGAARYVYRALQYITGLIADWLRGFSPPKEGPLSTIDTWFPKVLNAYLSSWKSADWSALDDITETIAERFQALVSEGQMTAADATRIVVGVGDTPGLNQLVAQVLDSIRQTGQASADAMLQIEALLGSQNEQLFRELQARFQSVALDRQLNELRAQLADLDDPAAQRRLETAIARAEEQLRTARTAREARQAREQLGLLQAQESSNDRQRSQLEQQIAALEEQQSLIEDQVSGYEVVNQLRERELRFLEEIFDLEQRINDERTRPTRDAEEEARRRAEAEFDYNVAIADTAGKLDLYRQKIAGLEQGSVEYFQTLTQIRQLEDQLAEERARAAQAAEEQAKRRADAEWEYNYAIADDARKLQMLRDRLAGVDANSEEGFRLRTQIAQQEAEQQRRQQEAAENLADAQWDLAYATADTAGRLALLEERRSRLSENDAEYYDLTRQIIDLQREQEEQAQRVADAQWQYNFATADTAGKLELIRERLGSVEQGSEEYYELLTQQAQLERQLAEEQQRAAEEAAAAAQAREDAEWAYNYAIADNATKLAMLREKLGEVEQGSVEYWEILGQIADVEAAIAQENERAAEEARRLAEQQAADAQARLDAEFQYQLAIADTDGKLALLRQKLATVPVGSVEYWQLLTQIHELEVQAAKEAAEGAETRGAAWQEEAGGIGEFIDKIGGLAEEGKRLWDEWIVRFDEGKTKLGLLKDEFLAFLGVQAGEGSGDRRHGGEQFFNEPDESDLSANLASIIGSLARLLGKAIDALVDWWNREGRAKFVAFMGYVDEEMAKVIDNEDFKEGSGALARAIWRMFTQIDNDLTEMLKAALLKEWEELWAGGEAPPVDHPLDYFEELNKVVIENLTNQFDEAISAWWNSDIWSEWDAWWADFWSNPFGDTAGANPGAATGEDLSTMVAGWVTGMATSLGTSWIGPGGIKVAYNRLLGNTNTDFASGFGNVNTTSKSKWEELRDRIIAPIAGRNDNEGIRGVVNTALTNTHSLMVTRWGNSDTTGMRGVSKAAMDAMYTVATSVFGENDNQGIWRVINLATAAYRRATEENFGTSDSTGMRNTVSGASGAIDRMLRATFGESATDGLWKVVSTATGAYRSLTDTNFGTDDSGGMRNTVSNAATMIGTTLTNLFGVDTSTGLWKVVASAIPGYRTITETNFGADDNGGIRKLVAEAMRSIDTVIRTIIGVDESSGIWGFLQGKITAIKDAILSPFKGARDEVGGILTTFGNNIITVLNNVLTRLGTFINGFRSAVNWIAEKLGVDPPFSGEYIPPQIEGLAKGTPNWRGGWARTGEQGQEIAVLPAGSTAGNLTYLPPGTRVIPNTQTSRMLERGIGFTDPVMPPLLPTEPTEPTVPIIPPEILTLWEWVRKGPRAVLEEAIGSLTPDLPGVFSGFGTALASKALDWGVETVKNIIDEFLSSWGLGGGGTPGSPDTPPDQPVPGGGDYPTGIGLAAALGAIIDGGYITQRFSAGHPAIDIGAGGWPQNGKKWVRALEGGVVLASGYRDDPEGEYVIIQDSRGRMYYYGHGYSGSRRYQAGASIGRGSAFMLMGATGRADGPHVHFELRLPNGQSVDPERVFNGSLRFAEGGIINEHVVGYGLRSGKRYEIGEAGPEAVVPLDSATAGASYSLVPMLQRLRAGAEAVLLGVRQTLQVESVLGDMLSGIEATLRMPQMQFAFNARGGLPLGAESGGLAALVAAIRNQRPIVVHADGLDEAQVRRMLADAMREADEELMVAVQRTRGDQW